MKTNELLEKVKFAIFDMDGTLVDSLGYFEKLWRNLGTKYFGNPDFKVDADFDKLIRTITLKDASILLRERYSINDTEENVFEFCHKDLEDFYITDVDAKEGVTEFLEYLKSRGVRMCVASATEPRLIKLSLEKCGLSDYFEFIISCTEVGCGKDKPDVFLAALERLCAEISDSCVFEDSYVAIETAKKAGFMTVGIYDKNNYEQERLAASSDIYISSSKTFKDLLDN